MSRLTYIVSTIIHCLLAPCTSSLMKLDNVGTVTALSAVACLALLLLASIFLINASCSTSVESSLTGLGTHVQGYARHIDPFLSLTSLIRFSKADCSLTLSIP